ncbi:MAG: outer membrane lipoprotein carrier protein LolA, partial [Saprospiraceae bacterium]|nr:outer membrane lipoprotein carrier protein LolA [Saprospiraceae bacterium]
PDQKILSNGQVLWIVLDDAKEVQIMSLDESTGLGALSPINILEQYCGDQFMAESMGTKDESGESMEIIEVAPLDKSEDIFKIRIEYHTEKKEIRKVKTFSKDGSRIILVASNYNFTPDFADVDFEYDSAQHPDYHIEDLR